MQISGIKTPHPCIRAIKTKCRSNLTRTYYGGCPQQETAIGTGNVLRANVPGPPTYQAISRIKTGCSFASPTKQQHQPEAGPKQTSASEAREQIEANHCGSGVFAELANSGTPLSGRLASRISMEISGNGTDNNRYRGPSCPRKE